MSDWDAFQNEANQLLTKLKEWAQKRSFTWHDTQVVKVSTALREVEIEVRPPNGLGSNTLDAIGGISIHTSFTGGGTPTDDYLARWPDTWKKYNRSTFGWDEIANPYSELRRLVSSWLNQPK